MATTVAELVEDTRRLVYGTSRVDLNRLDGGLDNVTTTVTVAFDLQGIVRGSLISVDDEIMYVLDSTPASKTAEVIRGYMGTLAAVHANAATVEVNPRFPREYIKEALKRVINSLGPRLFRVTAHDILTGAVNGYSYDMPVGDYYHVLHVSRKTTGSTTRPTLTRWGVRRLADSADFASGSALLLNEEVPVGSTLRLLLARPFDTSVFTDGTDVEADCGLTTSMVDIPPLGAAYRLISTREIPRTNMAAQPEPRHAEEVPAGHISSVATALKRAFDERVSEEQFRLRESYPYYIS